MAVDISLPAKRLEESDIRGAGAVLHFSFAYYAVELVPSGAYYATPDDTTSEWSVGLDGRVNLFSLGYLRPFLGVGFIRMFQADMRDTILYLTGGRHFNLGSYETISSVEAGYRTAASHGAGRFQAGFRFILRER